jgi:hypothetical protein
MNPIYGSIMIENVFTYSLLGLLVLTVTTKAFIRAFR